MFSRANFLFNKCSAHAITGSYKIGILKSSVKLQPFNYGQKIVHTSILNKSTVMAEVVSKPSTGKLVGYWFLGCGGMVYIAVALGGITRLTESGLSMVTWKLLGEERPRSQEEWLEEFERYKEFPEFKMKNQGMTVDEFKWIWWMEYGHRSWGRLIGAAFFIPATYFWTNGMLKKALKKRVVVCGALIAAQGLMGWYMVKSGLQAERFQGPSDIPRVSQYRLASHLGLAFTLYSVFLWSALDVLLPAEVPSQVAPVARKLRMMTHSCKALVFLTVVSGAFVAGLDAGLVYNSFPKMADKWIPDDILAYTPTASNFTENPTTVQFDHRILGISTLTLATATWLVARGHNLPGRSRTAAATMAAVAWTQATLGISTLLMYVPVPLAAAHQSGSLVLLSAALWLSHELKNIKRIPK